MIIFGYIITLIGICLLFVGDIYFGLLLFIVGGGFAQKLFFSLRSLVVVIEVFTIFYGFHYGFSLPVLFFIFVGFVLAWFNGKRKGRRDGRGIDMDSSTFDGFGGDGGADGGGD